MKHGDSKRLEEAIDSVLQETLLLLRSGRGDAYRSYLAQLLAVWASGYLEAKCREVMFMYTERRANPGVARYVAKRLDQFRNPRADKILELIGSFDADVARQLGDFAEGRIRSSINSIVSHRHRIAHGRSSEISILDVERYFGDARMFVRKMETLLLE